MRLQRLLPLLLLSWLHCFADTNNFFHVFDDELFTNSLTLGTNNVLILTNGAKATKITFASNPSPQFNQVYIDGIGTAWSNRITLNGGSNLIAVANGAIVAQVYLQGSTNAVLLNSGAQIPGGLVINSSSAKTNYFNASGASSVQGGITLYGVGNYVGFRDGSLFSGGISGGLTGLSVGNTLEIQNTTIPNGGIFNVGGDFHRFIFTDNASVSFASFTTIGKTNQITISDSSSLNIAGAFSQSHPYSITGGGALKADTFAITAPTATESLLLDGVHVEAKTSASLASPAFLNEAQLQTPTLTLAKPLTVSGTNAFVEASQIQGAPFQSITQATVTNGASLRSESITNVSVAVSGLGSRWDLTQPYLMASGALGYSISLSNNATANLGNVYIGYVNTNRSSLDSFLTTSAHLNVDGGSQLRCGDLWIGLNSGGNNAFVSNGGTVQAQNLAVGYFKTSGADIIPFEMRSNLLAISGAKTRVTISSNLVVGYRGTTNILTIMDGATVSASSAQVGFVKGNDFALSRSVLQISGNGSRLDVQGVCDGSMASSVQISDGAVLSAGDIKLPANVSIANGQILGGRSISSILVGASITNGGKVSAPHISFGTGGAVSFLPLIVSNINSAIVADRLDLLRIDPSHFTGENVSIQVVDGAEINARIVTLGIGAIGHRYTFNVNQGQFTATSPDGLGNFEMQNAQLTFSNGTFRVDHLLISDPNAGMLIGPMSVGGAFPPSNGELRVNGGHGIVEEIRGTNFMASLMLGESPNETCALSILQGITTVSNGNGEGILKIGGSGRGELFVSNAVVNVDRVAVGDGAMVSAAIAINESARIHARTLALNSASTVRLHLHLPVSGPMVSVDSEAIIGGEFHFNLDSAADRETGSSLPLLSAASVTGVFTNAPNLSRIKSDDNKATFVINYLPDGVLLSDFQWLIPHVKVAAALNVTNKSVMVSFPVYVGAQPQIESSIDLIHWESLAPGNLQIENGTAIWTLPIDGSPGARLFRAVIQP